jgi:hypothetical protein
VVVVIGDGKNLEMFKGKLQLPGSNMDEDYYQNYISINYTKNFIPS